MNKKQIDRFWRKVTKTETCWDWMGAKINGYGRLSIYKKHYYAHRISYSIAFGNIPKDLTIDHLCRNRACVNPGHLEAVTFQVNIGRRINGYQTCPTKNACVRGHLFTLENTYLYKKSKYCRKCNVIRQEIYRNK